VAAGETRRTDDVSGVARPASADDSSAAAELPADARQTAPADPSTGAELLAEAPPITDASPFTQEPVEVDPDTPDPPPQDVADLSSACVRFIAARYGVTLDFSPETLSLVDQWIRDASAERMGRAELTELVQSTAGAYLGEVIRRAFGGTWVTGDTPMAGWKLCLSKVYCAFNPIGMAREALLLEEAEGWHAHFELDPAEREAVEQRLAVLPAVPDAEFYAPSTRFDVVEILVDALRSAMHSRGLGRVRFDVTDYQ